MNMKGISESVFLPLSLSLSLSLSVFVSFSVPVCRMMGFSLKKMDMRPVMVEIEVC